MKSKRILFFVLCVATILFISMPNAYAIEKWQTRGNAYEISISDDYIPIAMPNNNFNTYEDNYTINGKLQTYTRVDEILLRNKYDSSLYIYVYRVVTSPQDGREWGFMGIGSYGGQWVNDEIKTSIQLRSGYTLENYQPKNNPNTTTGSIGVGLDSDGPSVSASVDFNHSELRVISNSNMGTNYYETIYDIDYGIFTYPFASGYIKGDIFSFGMITFSYSGSSVYLQIKHTVKYRDITPYTGSTQKTVNFTKTYY